jgi:hypothetical protein
MPGLAAELGKPGVRLAREGRVNVAEEVLLARPWGVAVHDARGRGVGREVADEDGDAPERELAAVQPREVDAVEALEVGFYGVGVLAEERDERR